VDNVVSFYEEPTAMKIQNRSHFDRTRIPAMGSGLLHEANTPNCTLSANSSDCRAENQQKIDEYNSCREEMRANQERRDQQQREIDEPVSVTVNRMVPITIVRCFQPLKVPDGWSRRVTNVGGRVRRKPCPVR